MLNLDYFFGRVLQTLNIPESAAAVGFLKTWANYERRKAGKPDGFNPLNTTWNLSEDKGQTMFNSAGVKNYSTIEYGIKATAKTLALNYYKPIVAVLKEGAPLNLTFQKTGVAKALRTWGSNTFADKFIDAAQSRKPAIKDKNKPTGTPSDNTDKVIKIVLVLLVVGLAFYTYTTFKSIPQSQYYNA